MLAKMPAFIFYPALLLWSLVYGVIGGIVFKLVAAYENWIAVNRYHYILWKKYPNRSYQKYISSIWATQLKGLPVELAEYTRIKVEQTHPSEPFPFLRILTNTVLMLFIAPYLMVTGMIKGPIYVFRQQMQARQRYLSR